ncbi:MAG: hypothetical protein LH472_02620 [Pyrinomonadaceae bacterium]|nr:hypothetical protein [Pyrinomonadaceae bacterium]
MSEIKQIEPKNWATFLEEFSTRNNNRRARFDVFRRSGETEEERQEARFEDASLKQNGDQHEVVVIRIDRSETDAEKMHDTITNVIGIAVQYDTDGSEDALQITDRENELISLRFESKVDGAS